MYAKNGIKAKGFTLIELLIVVIIVAILAAIVVPQFTDSSTEAKEAALDANLAAMRSAVELYKVQHAGKYPGATSSVKGTDCTTGGTITLTATSSSDDRAQALIEQMTMATAADGSACKIASDKYKYGPYLKSKLPNEPFMNKGSANTEIKVTTTGTMATVDDTGGWIYDTALGSLIANLTKYSSR